MAQVPCALEWLVDHELALAKRYRRFFTLLLLEQENPQLTPEQALGAGMRQCDTPYAFPGGLIAVVLSETDAQGALAALDRYREHGRVGRKSRFGIASYPEDNVPAGDFLALGLKRLRKADPNRPTSASSGRRRPADSAGPLLISTQAKIS